MCTGIVLKSSDNLVLFARTMDFSFSLEPKMGIFPRNYPIPFTYNGVLKEHYAFLGLTKNIGTYILADGVNEKGLVAATLYFQEYAHYHNETKEGANNLGPAEVVNWVLANYTSVEDVKEAFKDIHLVQAEVPFIGTTPPLHYVFTDSSGASIIVEPIAEGIKIYDNKLGVLTNAPDYPWHLTNVRNYIGLDPKQIEGRTLYGTDFLPFGQGSGTFGLPGDYTPPSRFIKTLFSKLSTEMVAGEENLVISASHILNGVDIPKGSVITQRDTIDYTQYTSFAVPTTQNYFFRMYDGSQISKVSLHDFDLDGNDITLIEVPDHMQFNTLTKE